MTVIPFDTLEFAEELKAAGVPEDQAKAHARALSKVAGEQLVTRDYLDTRLKETESRIITRLGGLMVMGFGILAILIKVL